MVEDARDESMTVTTLGNEVVSSARGETGIWLINEIDFNVFHVYLLESLSSEKNSVKSSAGARRNSFKLSFLPNAPEFVSVSSRAITTTGTGVAVLAVLGLKTKVFTSS